jgi:hypothetical protein
MVNHAFIIVAVKYAYLHLKPSEQCNNYVCEISQKRFWKLILYQSARRYMQIQK